MQTLTNILGLITLLSNVASTSLGTHPNPHFMAAVELVNSGRYVDAYKRFAEAEIDFKSNNEYPHTDTVRYKVFSLHQLNLMPEAANEAMIALNAGALDIWESGDAIPSVHYMLGVSFYNLNRLQDAADAFRFAATNFNDPNSYLSLGDALLHSQSDIEGAADAYVMSGELSGTPDYGRLQKARTWIADWRDYDALSYHIERSIEQSFINGTPSVIRAVDVTEILPRYLPFVHSHLHYSKEKAPIAPKGFNSIVKAKNREIGKGKGKKLRVAFISSDFGVHPVSSLIRGALMSFTEDVFVTAYCLTNHNSWWQMSISTEVDQMKPLVDISWADAAAIILKDKQDVIIDLNGHTLGSGLPILAHRVAPIQLSYLGCSETTGAPFIDYYVADPVAVPPDVTALTFGEKIGYLPSSFMVTDFAQLARAQALKLKMTKATAGLAVSRQTFVFATFCNYRKIDPMIFATWASILRQVPKSILWILQHPGHKEANVKLLEELKAAGIDSSRWKITPMQPWSKHTSVKGVADLVLDTFIKNGHTTTADALWAGVPVITLAGATLSKRWAASLIQSMGTAETITYSFKEYERLAVSLATSPLLLSALRRKVRANRWTHSPYQTIAWTDNFERFLKVAWEARSNISGSKAPSVSHLFVLPDKSESSIHPHSDSVISKYQGSSSGNGSKRDLLEIDTCGDVTVSSGVDEAVIDHTTPVEAKTDTPDSSGTAVKATSKDMKDLYKTKRYPDPLLLNIGGITHRQGWMVVNAARMEYVTDVVSDMGNLGMFHNHTVSAIYASHILEHVGYRDEVVPVLQEWKRVLRPGGLLFIGVPDLYVLAGFIRNDSLSLQDKYAVMRMVYGGQVDEFDYHKGGYTFDILKLVLSQAGFCNIQQIDQFNLFDDTTSMKYFGVDISLNVVASSCAYSWSQNKVERLQLETMYGEKIDFMRK